MKKYFLLFAFIATLLVTKAQTGLQFNQVLMPNGTMAVTTGSTLNIGTVPAGKVWKLENFGSDYMGCAYLRINGVAANLTLPHTSGATNFMQGAFWFPAGTQLSMYRSCNTSLTSTFFFSIIEFTVTP